MCRRATFHPTGTAGLLAGLLLAAVAGSAAPLAAQQTEEELLRHLQELQPRLDSAHAAADAARARAKAREQARRVASIDTLRIGPLHVLAPSDQHDAAEAFYRDVWEKEYAPFVDASPVLDSTTFTFQWAPVLGLIPVDGPARRVERLAWRPASSVRDGVATAIGMALGSEMPDSLRAWAGREVRDLDELADVVFREVTSIPSLSNRRCIQGDADACWASLGLDLDDTPLDEWYTPEERRAHVAAFGSMRRAEPLRKTCVEEGSVAACDLYLSQWFLPPPLPDQAPRRALVWLALREGGAGAWSRLRADPSATPSEALSAASGLSAHELAARWRDWMMSGAPETRAMLDPHLLIDRLWIVAFAAFAMRSTRWRLR
jgi:hypothetical protein